MIFFSKKKESNLKLTEPNFSYINKINLVFELVQGNPEYKRSFFLINHSLFQNPELFSGRPKDLSELCMDFEEINFETLFTKSDWFAKVTPKTSYIFDVKNKSEYTNKENSFKKIYDFEGELTYSSFRCNEYDKDTEKKIIFTNVPFQDILKLT